MGHKSYLVFHLVYEYFKMVANVGKVAALKSKVLSN